MSRCSGLRRVFTDAEKRVEDTAISTLLCDRQPAVCLHPHERDLDWV